MGPLSELTPKWRPRGGEGEVKGDRVDDFLAVNQDFEGCFTETESELIELAGGLDGGVSDGSEPGAFGEVLGGPGAGFEEEAGLFVDAELEAAGFGVVGTGVSPLAKKWMMAEPRLVGATGTTRVKISASKAGRGPEAMVQEYQDGRSVEAYQTPGAVVS